MHHKGTFALAGVFLVVALVVPIALFTLQAANDIIIIQNPSGMDTGGSLPTVPVEQVQQSMLQHYSLSYLLRLFLFHSLLLQSIMA